MCVRQNLNVCGSSCRFRITYLQYLLLSMVYLFTIVIVVVVNAIVVVVAVLVVVCVRSP